MAIPQNAAQVAKASLTRPQPASPESPRPATSPASAVTLSKLWLTGIAAWGHRWTTHLGDLPVQDNGELTIAGNLWAQGLAGVPENVLLATLGRFVEQGAEWPPNLPQVRAGCAGIPSLASVRRELTGRDTERSGFARLVWGYVDGYVLARADEDRAGRMIREAYDLARENVLAGVVTIPEASFALEAPKAQGVKVAPPEVARQHMEKIAQALDAPLPAGGPPTQEGKFKISPEAKALQDEIERGRDGRMLAAGPDA